jgi:hypothetical protein
MTLSYYAARANLSHLLQRHPDWLHAQFAAALGSSKAWVKKWLKFSQNFDTKPLRFVKISVILLLVSKRYRFVLKF